MRTTTTNRWSTCLLPVLPVMGLVTAVAALLAGCVVGPDYERPTVETPQDWRWKVAEPRDEVPRGEWWTVFGDPQLDELQRMAMQDNLDLQAAFYRIEQSRATARVSRSEFFPVLNANGDWFKYRTSGNSPSPVGYPIPSFTQEQFTGVLDLSYEIDLWGRVRRSFESARYLAMSTEAAYQATLLALQADVALTYFAIQGTEEQINILRQTIAIRTNAFEVIERRVNAGFGTDFEIERSKVEVAGAKAGLEAARQRRAELVNALAVLCGTPPSMFDGVISTNIAPLPQIAPNLPSDLLERRPDVAEAERELASRNAQIGVAKAAFFPVVSLTARGGYLSGELSDLFDWDSRVWALNPTIALPVFAGGRNRANLERSKMAFEEGVALYRQKVLVAFREVEDSLAALGFLEDQASFLEEAAEAARNSARISWARYRTGSINFIDLVDSEAVRLQAELTSIQAATEQRLAMVRLIKAMGGGWDSDEAAPSSALNDPLSRAKSEEEHAKPKD